MAAVEKTGPNAAQIEHWNGPNGEIWVRLQERLDNQLAPLGRMAMDKAAIREGEHILDIGCGTGQTTLELAERTGSGGKVLGVDISAPMLALAKQRLAGAKLTQASFAEGDAQTHGFSRSSFDLVFSRFGVMFFADPVAAFANLRSTLKKGGRLAFICWRPVQENPWVAVPMAAAFKHIPRPAPPEPGAPGEFAFANRERVRGILAGSGYRDISIEPRDTEVGRSSLDLAVETALDMGPVGAALREANSPEKRSAVAAAVREALAPFAGPDGLRMGAGVWVVEARNG